MGEPSGPDGRLPIHCKLKADVGASSIGTPHKCPLRTLAWEGRGGVTRLAISGAREHVSRKPTRARLACPRKIHHPDARQAVALFLIAPDS